MVYISTSCLKREDVLDSINELSTITKNIELSGGSRYQQNLLKNLKEIQKEKNLNFLLHSYFPPPKEEFILNFADENLNTKEFINKAMEYISELNIDYYSIHSGFKKTFKFKDEILIDGEDGFREQSIFNNVDWFYQNYPNYKIALENLFPNGNNKECCFMMDFNSISSILDRDKRIYLLFDLGHIKVSSTHFNFDYMKVVDSTFSKYYDRILEIHLSENFGLKDEHLEILADSVQYKIVKKYKNLILENSINLVIESRVDKLEKLQKSYSLFNNLLKGKE